MKNKICPILGAGPLEINTDCKRESCAWFTSSKCCALLLLAESADSAAGYIDEIAHSDPMDISHN